MEVTRHPVNVDVASHHAPGPNVVVHFFPLVDVVPPPPVLDSLELELESAN